MFAPVATRIRTYELPVTDLGSRNMSRRSTRCRRFQEWFAEAVKEPWVVEHDEIDIILAKRDAAGNA